MITNTDIFYTRAKEYQDKRKEIMDEYETRLAHLEATKGSKYYTEELKKAKDKKDEALTTLKNEYAEYFNISLSAMRKANGSRAMTPPTEEELRTLQLLKMKEKPTEAEISAAANTLKGNATCLSVLTEIAHNAGIMHNYISYRETQEMPVNEVEETVKGLASCVRDFMEYDTTRAARMARKYQEEHHGKTPDAPELTKRPLFDTKAECFDTIAGISGDSLTAFCTAVD